MSVYCQVWGNFDFNKTPLAPAGTKLLVHIEPEIRESYAPRATNGWYLGPAMRNYRCYRVYIVETKAERIVDNVAWFPIYVSIPTSSSTTTLLSAAYDLTQVLLSPRKSSPLPPLVASHTKARLELSTIFKNSLLSTNQASTDEIIEDEEQTNDILSKTNVVTTDNNINNNTINTNTDNITTTLHDNNNNVHVPTNTTIIINNDNITVPRVLVDPVNICLPRVADLDINSPTQAPKTYTNLTHNPDKCRRNAKKKVLARDSFPQPIIEKIVETE